MCFGNLYKIDWGWYLVYYLVLFQNHLKKEALFWSNYSDLTRPHPKRWFSKVSAQHLPAVDCSYWGLRWMEAMVDKPRDLTLEPKLCDVTDGDLVDVVITLTLKIPGCMIGRTSIHGETIRSDCAVSGRRSVVTLFGVRKQMVGDHIWLVQSDQTAIVEHAPPALSNICNLAETCAGIGAVDVGFSAAGASVVITNESNPKFGQILHAKGYEVVLGNNHLRSVIARVAKSQPGCVAGGVSCQPFSKLGDRKEGSDPRAASLLGALQMIHFSQASIGILECTPTAMESEWFQKQLAIFTQSTGFVCHQKILELHECWPARRSRWWCVLSRPELGIQEFPSLPKLDVQPNLFHLMPKLPKISEKDLQALSLDLYELRNFHQHGRGISQHEINFHKPMPTAVHSWGSQLRHCECGCRSAGFHPDRLQSKGLYGQLIRTEGTTGPITHNFPNMRHPHPKEVALANGLLPSYVDDNPSNPRLWLAAVGQLASPIQGLWVFANVMYMSHQAWGISKPKPIDILGGYIEKLFSERDELLQIPPDSNRYMQLFQQSWRKLYHHEPDQYESPAIEPDQMEKTDGQIQAPLLIETPQCSITARGKGKGTGTTTTGMTNHETAGSEEISDEAIRQALSHVEALRVNESPEFQNGGVPGFAVKRKRSPSLPRAKRSKVEEQIPEEFQEKKMEEEDMVEQNREAETSETVKPEHEDAAVMDQTSVPVVIPHPEAKPITMRVASDVKLHQIVAAEEAIGSLTPPIVIADILGNPMHPQSNATPNDNIVLHSGGLNPGRCPMEKHNEPPTLREAKRSLLLWKQGGWMAVDELQYYVQQISEDFPQQVGQGIFPTDDPSCRCRKNHSDDPFVTIFRPEEGGWFHTASKPLDPGLCRNIIQQCEHHHNLSPRPLD